jgi:amino acid adenylation domain-containing protein
LRTTFKLSEGSEVVQEIGDTYEYTLLVEDLRGYAEAIRHEEALNLAKQLIGVPCDLEKGPLWRALLIRIDIEEYILALSFHHIIFDGWSLGIFIRELAELYETFLNKREPSDLDQKIQYVDYAVWHRGYFQGEVESKQMDYWKKQLSGNLPVLELPTDGVRPDVQTFKGSFHITQMPLELYHSLKRLSVENAVTLFMSTLAAFKVLLSRYCDQNDIIVGFPISGRNRSDIENVIGVFVNTIPLRKDLSGKPTFIELLKQVKEMSLGAYANQDVPFEQLVQAVQPERNLSYNPLFQVLFTYQNAIPPIELNELSVSFEQIDPGTSKFDLSLDIFEGSDEIAPSLVFEYNTDLFCKERIERMSEHYIMLIRSICDNPQLPVNKLEMLTAGERNRLLVEWDSGISQQENATIVNLFEKQAGKTPESEAVKFNDNKLLYKELNQKANQLAHYLIKLGVTPEVPVGISTERSLEMVLATLAVLKAGGAYVPLDPAYPIERLQYMLSDSRIPVLLCDCQIDKSKLDYNGKIIDLNVVWQDLDSECRENPGVQINPENLAYVIYTSGTTGNPKGTMVTHGNAASAYLAWESAYRLREDVTSHLQMASFSFDVCTGDMLRALLSGGKLVLCPAKYLLEPGKLYELMVEEKVDCAEFVPAVIRNLIAYLEEKQLKLDFMKLLIVGSDNWYVNEYKYFRSFIGQNTRLINSYGLTEATIDSTFFEANANEVPDAESVPIGKPFENTKIIILDANLQMVPIGYRVKYI